MQIKKYIFLFILFLSSQPSHAGWFDSIKSFGRVQNKCLSLFEDQRPITTFANGEEQNLNKKIKKYVDTEIEKLKSASNQVSSERLKSFEDTLRQHTTPWVLFENERLGEQLYLAKLAENDLSLTHTYIAQSLLELMAIKAESIKIDYKGAKLEIKNQYIPQSKSSVFGEPVASRYNGRYIKITNLQTKESIEFWADAIWMIYIYGYYGSFYTPDSNSQILTLNPTQIAKVLKLVPLRQIPKNLENASQVQVFNLHKTHNPEFISHITELQHRIQNIVQTTPNRISTIMQVLKRPEVLPPESVIHIVGPGQNFEEWLIPMAARPDIKIVLFESDLYLYWQSFLANENMQLELWKQIQSDPNYRRFVDLGSNLPTFFEFKKAIHERLSISLYYQNNVYTSKYPGDNPNESKAIPKANLISFNMPLVNETDGSFKHGLRDYINGSRVRGVLKLIKSQAQSLNTIVWVNSENISLRMGDEIVELPSISLPTSQMAFKTEYLFHESKAQTRFLFLRDN